MAKRLTYVLVLLAVTLPVTGAELVREFSGQGFATKSMAIEVHLVDGRTGFHKGLILQTKYPGNGVRLFNESGTFRLRVSATLSRWNLKVEELTREEAELYTPARP